MNPDHAEPQGTTLGSLEMIRNIGKGRGGEEVQGREASEEGGADFQRRQDGSRISENGDWEGRLWYSVPQRGRALRQSSEDRRGSLRFWP